MNLQAYKNSSSEEQEQATVFEWAEYQSNAYPELRFMYHPANEGKRSITAGATLKKVGLKKGVPDICLPAACGCYHGLYIEMKFGKNKPTKEQLEYLIFLNAQGYCVKVCYSADEAINTIAEYLKLKGRKTMNEEDIWCEDCKYFRKTNIFGEGKCDIDNHDTWYGCPKCKRFKKVGDTK